MLEGDTDAPAPSPSMVARRGATGVTKRRVIRLARPARLQALLWLNRQGYDQVGCIRAGCGAQGVAHRRAA
jgi:hypothetical protein